ncbi:MAG TPA: hypothetical protein VKB49_14765 [Candidatus Sulfotelmatobacter sp.]|nr:hypothetical protein [Candidatus Sulfotelmatobacter sp.]
MKTLTLAVSLSAFVLCPALRAQSSSPTHNEAPLFVKVQLDRSVKLSSLKAGESVEGKLARDVYSPENKVFASGSPIHLTVSRVERKRKIPSEKWPWIAKIFLPHHENFPVFNDAAIFMPDGTKSAIQTSLLSSNRMKEVRMPPSRDRAKKSVTPASIEMGPAESGSEKDDSASQGPVLYLEAHQTSVAPSEIPGWLHPGLSTSSALPAGTVCRILLLEDISASKSHAGDEIYARLLEPLLSDSQIVIPAGSLFDGRVMKATRPRIPSRAGSLTITFDSVQLPEGHRIPVSASLASVGVNAGSPLKMDREGRLHGSRPGAMWMLINGGVAGGIAKEVDDGTQLLVEAIISTATDASTAGTARIAGTIVSAAFMLTRKGHDVVLPNNTEMTITLNRPLTLSAQVTKTSLVKNQASSGD